MSISSILDTGNTALNAQRLALEVTSENITNVNTPGYSRQTAILEPGVTTVVNGLAVGSGVQVGSIQRAYDSFLQAQTLAANASQGNATTTNSALQMVQPLFSDLTSGSGLGQAMQDFFSAWQDLSANPQGVPERQTVLSKGAALTDQFHQMSTNLTNIKANMNQSLEGLASTVNDQLSQVAQLNNTIKQTEVLGGKANEMRDQRDLLIQKLSQNVGVTFAEQSDGTVNVNLTSGQALVTGITAASLSLQPNAGNSGYYDVMLTPPGGGGAVDATSFIGGAGNRQGNIGAMLKTRDTTVNSYSASLDELASTLATQVNTVHAAGFGLTGSTGVNFFTTPATAATINVGITSTSDIAAADTDPTAGGTGNNRNAIKIADIYHNQISMSTGSTTLGGFYTSLVGKVGVDVQNAGRADTQSTNLVNQLQNLRDSNSGVSLDEELANLTKYQKAYQGAAKLINVGTEMLDTILGMIQ